MRRQIRSTSESFSLYHSGESAWLEAMAELVCQKRLKEVDTGNLAEHLEDMARRDRREVMNRRRSGGDA